MPSTERPEEPFNMTNPQYCCRVARVRPLRIDTSPTPKGRSPRNDTAIGPSCATDHPTARSSWSFMPFRAGIATRAGIKSGGRITSGVPWCLMPHPMRYIGDQAQFVVLGCRVSGSPPIRRFFIAMSIDRGSLAYATLAQSDLTRILFQVLQNEQLRLRLTLLYMRSMVRLRGTRWGGIWLPCPHMEERL
jgi:hypothetical protein